MFSYSHALCRQLKILYSVSVNLSQQFIVKFFALVFRIVINLYLTDYLEYLLKLKINFH